MFGPNSTNHERASIGSNHKILIYESRSGVDQALWGGMIKVRCLQPSVVSYILNKREVCARYQASLKVSDLLTTEEKYTTAVKRSKRSLTFQRKSQLPTMTILGELEPLPKEGY